MAAGKAETALEECSLQVPEASVDVKSRGAKRKARKKRNNLAAATQLSTLISLPEDTPSTGDADAQEASNEAHPAPTSLAPFPEADQLDQRACLKAADLVSLGSCEDTTEAPSTTDVDVGAREGEVCLNFDWSPEGPPIDETTESAAVELEVDWSEGGSYLMETRWSAWLPNGLTGSAAEWHWVTTRPPMVAFLKNTFVETADVFPAEERIRPRSLPARPRPAEL